jgi:hypothetical protein
LSHSPCFIVFMTFSEENIMKLLIMNFSQVIRDFLSLKFTYSLEYWLIFSTRSSPPILLSPIFIMHLYFCIFVVMLITCHIAGEKTWGS